MGSENSVDREIYENLTLDNVVPENDDTQAVRQDCVVKMGKNKKTKIPSHFKPTQLGARGRKLQTPPTNSVVSRHHN